MLNCAQLRSNQFYPCLLDERAYSLTVPAVTIETAGNAAWSIGGGH